MRILRKIAKPCGIIGGLWGVLFSILLLIFVSARTVTTSVLMDGRGLIVDKTVTAGSVNPFIYIIIFSGLMGILAILSTILIGTKYKVGMTLIWVSILALLVCNLLSQSTSILFFAPAIILLTMAAIGLFKTSKSEL